VTDVLLKRVKLESVLAFKEASVEFAPGLNVVLSPNEGGKSSLLRGIVAGLYADSSSRKSDVLALARWGSGGLFRIELELRLAGLGYRLVRDFGSKEQAIFREGEERSFAKGKRVDEFLKDHMPLADQNLFLRVCGVRHEELGAVGDGTSAIGEKLEEILGGGWGNVTPASVKRTVEAKRRELLRGTSRLALDENWGLVKRHAESVARAEREFALATDISRRREGLLKTASSARGGIECISAELEILRSRRQKAAQLTELEKKEETARGKAEELRKRTERLRELLSRKRMLVEDAGRFPAALKERGAASLNELMKALELETLLGREIEGAGTVKPRASCRPGFIVAASLILLGIAGALLLNKSMLLLLAAGVVLLGWCVRRGAAAGRALIAPEKGVELERLRERRNAWSGGRSLADSRTLLDAFSAWSDQIKDVQTRLEEVAGAHEGAHEALSARLDAEYGNAAREARAIAEERSALVAFKVDAGELLRLEREIRLKEDETASASVFLEGQERELAGLDAHDANEARERLEAEREDLKRAERKAEILDSILETLDEARSAMSGFLAERLPPLAAAHLSRITGGRYGTLFIDPLTMGIETAPAAGDADAGAGASHAPDRIGPDAVSQGTRDQIYLAVRLALVDLVSRGEPQPLFLDDPFVHFDPERRARALDLVREFAAGHQVIVFTCDPRYRETSAHLIELPGRA
jgi:DNA repair exonuclease SbcCD ATPase subunit